MSITCSLVASLYLGWNTNYSLYLIASGIIILYSTTLKLVLKSIELFIICVLFIGFYLATKDGFSLYSLDPRLMTMLGVCNFIVCISSIGFLTYRNFLENKRLTKRLKELSEHDPLTGIYNRRFFNEYIEIEGKRMLNHIIYKTADQNNFGIAVIDLDNFKRVNDRFGHLAGDQILVEVVELIKSHIFSRDIFCRYGGEEFIILFTNTDVPGIYSTLERIRKEIDIHPFHIKNMDKPIHLTISIGFASFNEKRDVNKIIELADKRMYTAKQRGKNEVVTM